MSFDFDAVEREWTSGFPDEQPHQRPHRAPVRSERRGSVEDLRRWRIEQGDCPRVCPGRLEDDACPVCGWSLLEERMRDRLAVREVAVLPQAELPLDEFAPAEVDAA